MKSGFCAAALATLALFSALRAPAQEHDPKITTPKQFFGFNIGDDYKLVNYTQFEAYMKKLAGESDRMKLVEIGKTEEGRPQYTVIVTSRGQYGKAIALSGNLEEAGHNRGGVGGAGARSGA